MDDCGGLYMMEDAVVGTADTDISDWVEKMIRWDNGTENM